MNSIGFRFTHSLLKIARVPRFFKATAELLNEF